MICPSIPINTYLILKLEFLVTKLLCQGADPKIAGDGGSTPLHNIAKRKGYEKVAESLLSWGAAADQENEEGLCPLDIAYNGHLDGMTAQLMKHLDKRM